MNEEKRMWISGIIAISAIIVIVVGILFLLVFGTQGEAAKGLLLGILFAVVVLTVNMEYVLIVKWENLNFFIGTVFSNYIGKTV